MSAGQVGQGGDERELAREGAEVPVSPAGCKREKMRSPVAEGRRHTMERMLKQCTIAFAN